MIDFVKVMRKQEKKAEAEEEICSNERREIVALIAYARLGTDIKVKIILKIKVMFEQIKHNMTIEGVMIYPIVSLLIFFLFRRSWPMVVLLYKETITEFKFH
jgi:hypothetical protein